MYDKLSNRITYNNVIVNNHRASPEALEATAEWKQWEDEEKRGVGGGGVEGE